MEPCVPPKSTDQNPVFTRLTVAEALNSSGVCEPVAGEPEVDFDRMGAIARLVAAEPGIANLAISKRLEMSRTVVIRYMKRLKQAISEGRLELSACVEEGGEDVAVEYVGDDYNPSESIEATLRLIRGQKAKLERKQRAGKVVSTAQIEPPRLCLGGLPDSGPFRSFRRRAGPA